MLGKVKVGLANHWPLIPLLISVVGISTAVALGATKQAMITVGTSNLPMVLGLSSASLAVIAAVMCSANLPDDHNQKKPVVSLVVSAIIGAIVIGSGYAAVHFGIASVLPSTLTIAESLGAQAGIGFGMGLIPTFCIISIFTAIKGNFKDELHTNLAVSLGMGIAVSASAAGGPAIAHAMGASAVDAMQNQALEATISVGIALLSCWLLGKMLGGAEYIKENCGKMKQA